MDQDQNRQQSFEPTNQHSSIPQPDYQPNSNQQTMQQQIPMQSHNPHYQFNIQPDLHQVQLEQNQQIPEHQVEKIDLRASQRHKNRSKTNYTQSSHHLVQNDMPNQQFVDQSNIHSLSPDIRNQQPQTNQQTMGYKMREDYPNEEQSIFSGQQYLPDGYGNFGGNVIQQNVPPQQHGEFVGGGQTREGVYDENSRQQILSQQNQMIEQSFYNQQSFPTNVEPIQQPMQNTSYSNQQLPIIHNQHSQNQYNFNYNEQEKGTFDFNTPKKTNNGQFSHPNTYAKDQKSSIKSNDQQLIKTHQLQPSCRKMSETYQQNAPNLANVDDSSKLGGASEGLSDMIQQIFAEQDQLGEDSKDSHYQGEGSVEDDQNTYDNISASQSNTQSHPIVTSNQNTPVLLNHNSNPQMKNRSVERQLGPPSSVNNFGQLYPKQVSRPFNLSHNDYYIHQNDQQVQQFDLQNQERVQQQSQIHFYNQQQMPSTNFQINQGNQNQQQRNNYQNVYDAQLGYQDGQMHQMQVQDFERLGQAIDSNQQQQFVNNINQIELDQQFIKDKMMNREKQPAFVQNQGINQYNRAYINQNTPIYHNNNASDQMVNNSSMGPYMMNYDPNHQRSILVNQVPMYNNQNISQKQNVAVAEYQERINRQKVQNQINEHEIQIQQMNSQQDQYYNHPSQQMMTNNYTSHQNQANFYYQQNQMQNQHNQQNLINQMNKLSINQQYSYEQQPQQSIMQDMNYLQNNPNQNDKMFYPQQQMYYQGKKNNSQQNLDTHSLEPGFSQQDNQDFYPQVQLSINYDHYNKTPFQKKKSDNSFSQRGKKKNKVSKGRGVGSQKSNYHRNEIQNMLGEVDISDMECNSQNNNQSHLKLNSHGQLSGGLKATDTQTNTTEGFSNRAVTNQNFSDRREFEGQEFKRISDQGSYYGNQNDDGLSNNAQFGGKSGAYAHGRSSGDGQRQSIRSGQGSGGQGNSNDANTSNKSYDDKIAQIQHDIKLAKKDPDKEFEVLNGKIYDLATKKVGSKFLQEHLSVAKSSLINRIIEQIDGVLPELMTDNYGNYFCSELINYLQPQQRIHFLKQIKGQQFIDISCNSRGTWALQNIIYAATQDKEFEIIQETLTANDNICKLSQDKEGHHMIEKIIMTFNEDKRLYIFEHIFNHFDTLAKDKQGLCVMKKLIEQTMKVECQKKIVEKILENVLEYVQNAYGNFVVSEVLTRFSYDICAQIYNKLKTHFVQLSQFKFSSKCIEVCINMAPATLQEEIINEFCESPYLNKVVQSGFGNFVLQKTLENYCKVDKYRIVLIEKIIGCLHEVNDFRIQTKWCKEILSRIINNQAIIGEDDQRRLNNLLMAKVDEIDKKQKLFKQQQQFIYRDVNNSFQRDQGQANQRQGYNNNQYDRQQPQTYQQYNPNSRQQNPQMSYNDQSMSQKHFQNQPNRQVFNKQTKKDLNFANKQKQGYQNKRGNLGDANRGMNIHQSYQYKQSQEKIMIKQESITFANQMEQIQQNRQVIKEAQRQPEQQQFKQRNRSNSRNEVKSSSGGTGDKDDKDTTQTDTNN